MAHVWFFGTKSFEIVVTTCAMLWIEFGKRFPSVLPLHFGSHLCVNVRFLAHPYGTIVHGQTLTTPLGSSAWTSLLFLLVAWKHWFCSHEFEIGNTLPVVLARGVAEVAWTVYCKTVFIYRTCMRRAPARPVRASFVRSCCRVDHVVVHDRDLRAITLQCNAKRTPSSHFRHLQTALFTPALQTSHFNHTFHTSSHLTASPALLIFCTQKLETTQKASAHKKFLYPARFFTEVFTQRFFSYRSFYT